MHAHSAGGVELRSLGSHSLRVQPSLKYNLNLTNQAHMCAWLALAVYLLDKGEMAALVENVVLLPRCRLDVCQDVAVDIAFLCPTT